MVTFLSVLLRMKIVPEKCCRENQNTILYSITVFLKSVPFVRKCGKNIVDQARPQMAI